MTLETRRLTVVMAVDFAGFSRLMRSSGRELARRIEEMFSAVIAPTVASAYGSILHRGGDGLIAEFPSAGRALAAAAAIIRGTSDRERQVAEGQRLELRIGIHVGEIASADGHVSGDAVNIATRLERLATPGVVVMSEQAVDNLPDDLDLELEEIDGPRLRSAREPLRVYGYKVRYDAPELWERFLTEPSQRAPWASVLGRLEQSPIGAHVSAAGDSLILGSTLSPDDAAAANHPITRSLHGQVQAKVSTLCGQLARIHNQPVWEDLVPAAEAFRETVAGDTVGLADRITQLYSAMLTLGSFLELDEELRRDEAADGDPLPHALRRSFSDLIRTAAPWVRLFPTACALDDAAGAYLSGLQGIGAAKRFLNAAAESALIDTPVVDGLLRLLRSPKGAGFQQQKATTHGLFTVRNVAKVSLAILTFYVGAASNIVADHSVIAKKIGNVILGSETAVQELLSNESRDVQFAVSQMLEHLRADPTFAHQAHSLSEGARMEERPGGRSPTQDSSAPVSIDRGRVPPKGTQVYVWDPDGAPVTACSVTAICDDEVVSSDQTINGVAQINLPPEREARILFSHPEFLSAQVDCARGAGEVEVVLRIALGCGSLTLRTKQLFNDMEGQLHTVIDDRGRPMLYAERMTIEGGVAQPVRLEVGRDIRVEDSHGRVAVITPKFLMGRIALLDFSY